MRFKVPLALAPLAATCACAFGSPRTGEQSMLLDIGPEAFDDVLVAVLWGQSDQHDARKRAEYESDESYALTYALEPRVLPLGAEVGLSFRSDEHSAGSGDRQTLAAHAGVYRSFALIAALRAHLGGGWMLIDSEDSSAADEASTGTEWRPYARTGLDFDLGGGLLCGVDAVWLLGDGLGYQWGNSAGEDLRLSLRVGVRF